MNPLMITAVNKYVETGMVRSTATAFLDIGWAQMGSHVVSNLMAVDDSGQLNCNKAAFSYQCLLHFRSKLTYV